MKKGNINISNRKFFRFHPGVPQRVEWLLRCNAPNEFYNLPLNKLRSKRICSKHFQREDFVNSKRRKLNPLAVPIHYRKADTEENILTDISNGRISEEINKEGSHEENNKKNFTREAIKEKHIKGSCHSSNSSLAEDSLGTDFWNVQFNKSVQVQYPSKHLARANTTSQSMEKKDEGRLILGLYNFN